MKKLKFTEEQIVIDLRDADHPAMSQPFHKNA
jgi:hypothetical protein